jgi:hypothetical protein
MPCAEAMQSQGVRVNKPYREHSSRAAFSRFEFIVCIFVVLFLLMGVVYINLPRVDWDEEGPPHIPPYRWANAMYVKNELERIRVATLGYLDMHSRLPGESGSGGKSGMIERARGENRGFFEDLHDAGFIRREEVLIRGRTLDVYWTRLASQGNATTEGNFFKLPGVNIHEARAVELKYDDGKNFDGDVLYTVVDDEHADLYVRLELY